MSNNSGLTYLSGLLRAGTGSVGAAGRAPRRRDAATFVSPARPSPRTRVSSAPAAYTDAGIENQSREKGSGYVSPSFSRDEIRSDETEHRAVAAAHATVLAVEEERPSATPNPLTVGWSPAPLQTEDGNPAARHGQPARVFHASPKDGSTRLDVRDFAGAVESDAARTGESARASIARKPHTLEAHINQLRTLMQTRGAEVSDAAEAEGEAGKTSHEAIVSPRAGVGAVQTQSTHPAKQTRTAHASRTRESQEGSAARMTPAAHTRGEKSPFIQTLTREGGARDEIAGRASRGEAGAGIARAPKLTINRLDVQVVNRADPQPPARPTPHASASASQPDPWGAPDRRFLGRFFY